MLRETRETAWLAQPEARRAFEWPTSQLDHMTTLCEGA